MDKRFGILLRQLFDKPSLSIPAATGSTAACMAAYRFFDNDSVNEQRILQPHIDATVQRIAEHPVVLVAQDTTETDLTRKQEKVGGPLNSDSRWGIFIHPLFALTPERLPLGLLGAKFYSRDPEEFAKPAAQKKKERAEKEIEEKESYRWLESYIQASEVAKQVPTTQIICIGDSESDIFDIYAHAAKIEGRKADFLVRAKHLDRSLQNSSKGLRERLLGTKILGKLTIHVEQREAAELGKNKRKQARSAREAHLTVRAMTTVMLEPDRSKLDPAQVQAILVTEPHPPAGEEPIEWLLVTSLPIETYEQVCLVIAYYCVRWEIEIYFRVLKSGCQIEKLQLETTERMNACMAMYLIVAWRVMHLMMLGRTCPEMSCDAALDESEWKSVYEIVTKTPAPQQPPSLGEMVKLIAQLGGYQGRTHDGPPGPKAMWIGLQRMKDFALAYRTFRLQESKPKDG